MVKLTEDMIVARTRVSDMNHVKKLNCWGAELSDISVLRKLTNVEVLSLSVNSISTLADIQYCKNLQELYIRKNQIPDISEICWLRDLPRLKNLWLEENPCAAGDPELYRQTVIRNIPQLQKLDNVAVASEEMADAMRHGIDLDHPVDGGSDNQTSRIQGQRQVQEQGQRQEQQQVPRQEQQHDTRRVSRSSNYEQQEYEQPQRKESIQVNRVLKYWLEEAHFNTFFMRSPSRRVSNQVWPEERPAAPSQPLHQSYSPTPLRNSHWEEEEYGNAQTEYAQRYSSNCDDSYSRQREATPDDGLRRHSIREESRYQDNHQQQQHRPQRNSYSGPPSSDVFYRGQEVGRPMQEFYASQPSKSRSTTPSERSEGPSSIASQERQLSRAELNQGNVDLIGPYSAQAIVDHHYEATYRQQVDQQLEGAHQLVAQRAMSPQRPYPVRPKNRNSNVLSAILCLIKEIDGPSLEVVEMAVRCRMEELED